MKQWMVDELGNSFKENVLDLFDKTYDRAYELGYRDGSNDNNSGYDKGLEDAWECLKRIIGMGEPEEICEAGGLRNFVCKYSAQEAIDKVNEYCKQKKETFKVGDVVQKIDEKFELIVTNVHESTYEFDNSTTTCFDGIKKDGTCLRSCPMKYYIYTGRHFDHVSQMLKLFRGNDNETDTYYKGGKYECSRDSQKNDI